MSQATTYAPLAHRNRVIVGAGWPASMVEGSLHVMDDTTVAAADDTTTSEADVDLIEDELLVEEISIDGMCGVY